MPVGRTGNGRTIGDANGSLVAVDRFVQATRDSGYKGTTSAVAELVDNALQAGATRVAITIERDSNSGDGGLRVAVIDNGSGMGSATLLEALRFGGTTRFNDRHGLGRYGMGLPNSSLSQARRLEVHTWKSPRATFMCFLDVDEIVSGRMKRVPKPSRVRRPRIAGRLSFDSGTLVVWTRCDRLDHRRPTTIARKLRPFLGRVFRYFIWDGVRIEVNGEPVDAIDPLFLHHRSLTRGGAIFGKPLEYEISLSLGNGRGTADGRVRITFSELPVHEWHQLSNEEKRRLGVSKAAGVSVVRANREIDYGWFFMGEKRKENYDDWWRCEVQFDPSLDEGFGITHTKQQIRPSADLVNALVPDLEATAKALNRRVRKAHERLKTASQFADAEEAAETKDQLLPPLPRPRLSATDRRTLKILERQHPRLSGAEDSQPAHHCRYSIVAGESMGTRFFRSYRRKGQVILVLNTEHPFYKRIYRPLAEQESPQYAILRRHIDLMLLAAARAEATTGKKAAAPFLENWSDTFATFLQT